MQLSPQPTQGYFLQKLTMTATISGPAADRVVRVRDAVEPYILPRQTDGSFRGLTAFMRRGASSGPEEMTFEAFDAQGEILCCASTTVTAIGKCTNAADCGSGGGCLALGLCYYSDCLDAFDCPDDTTCQFNGTCMHFE